MAPEQVRGQAVDARADIFAFGAVLYGMLAGRRAFQADTAADTISAILGADPPDLVSSSARHIPPALQRIVGRCLEKDPAARFQSVADLAFALQSLTGDSTPSGTGHVTLPSAGVAMPGRRRRDWWLAAAALAGLGVGIGQAEKGRRSARAATGRRSRSPAMASGSWRRATCPPAARCAVCGLSTPGDSRTD